MLAAMSTILSAVGYMWGPVGVEPEIALINRILGVITAWVVAAIGYLFIRTRVAIRRHEWLQAGQVGLAGKMNGEQWLDALGENIRGLIAEYTNAQAGELFIKKDDVLIRRATYDIRRAACRERVSQYR